MNIIYSSYCHVATLLSMLLFFSTNVHGNGSFPGSVPQSFGATTSCKEMLESFAYMTSNFTYCAIRHARPITLCQECVTSYLEAKQVYNAILKIEDMGGGLCRDQLINLDRLQVVSSGIGYVDQLWSGAFCDSCFDFINGSPRLTDPIQVLLNASAVLQNCIATYHNTTEFPDNITCTNCGEQYLVVNDIYNNIKADSGDINFCMDIIDMINTTRYRWSKVFGCCNDRMRPERIFIGIVTGILVATFLFYLMVYMFTRKAEHRIVQQNRWKEKFKKRASISSATRS